MRKLIAPAARLTELCLYDSAHEHIFTAGMNGRKMRLNRKGQQNWSGDFKPFLPQPLHTQSERGFNRNPDSRITIRKMQFRQNFRALADKVCNQRVRKRTVHVADAFKIQNDLIVRMHKGVYLGKTKSRRLFAVRQKIPELG
jgi:hypothetical protein